MNEKLYKLLKEPLSLKSQQELIRRYDNPVHEFKEDDNEYIGVATANIRDFNFNNKIIKAAHISDSYVVDEKRREGIFSNLYRKLEDNIKSDGVELFLSYHH